MTRRIAVFMPNWIGDGVMATPALRALRNHAGRDGRLIGIMQEPIAAVLAGLPWLDEVWLRAGVDAAPEVDWRVFSRRIREARIDLSIHLIDDFASALAARLGGVRERVGHACDLRGWLLTTRLRPPSPGGRRAQVASTSRYLEIVRAAGCATASEATELATTPDEEALADRAWARLRLAPYDRPVVLHSGARSGSAKRWPERHCAALAARVAREMDVPVVILAGPAEQESAARIVAVARHPRVVRLVDPPPSIGLSKATIKRALCLVSTDSGPRHIGGAFGVPVVALFGPTAPAWTDTRHSAEIALSKPLPCSPCGRHACPLGHRACMEELGPDQVFDALVRAVDMRAPTPSAPLRRASPDAFAKGAA